MFLREGHESVDFFDFLGECLKLVVRDSGPGSLKQALEDGYVLPGLGVYR